MRKTPKMRAAEDHFGRPIEELVPALVNEHGRSGAAEALGIPGPTLDYWLLRMHVVIHRVAVRPGERIEIVKDTDEGVSCKS